MLSLYKYHNIGKFITVFSKYQLYQGVNKYFVHLEYQKHVYAILHRTTRDYEMCSGL